MKTIYDNEDLYYQINITSTESENQIYPQDFEIFVVELYTTDPHNPISYTADDCVDDVLHINSTDLKKMASGAIKIRFRIGIEDENYEDGVYNQTLERQTGYFLKKFPQPTQNQTTN